jgi:peptidoglycan-N-acetylglucosamine deacetylase
MRCDIRILQSVFPSVLFSTTAHGIHLTFDDGPHPLATPLVLEILRARHIRASFFLLGKNVEQYPDLAQQIVAEGHQIGNHTYTHSNIFFKGRVFAKQELLQTEEIFEAVLEKRSKYFRPPYGYFHFSLLRVLQELNMTCVLWSVDSKDYRPSQQWNIQHRIVQQTSNGSILLFHDNKNTAPALHTYLPTTLDTLLGKGFDFHTFPS